MRREGRSPACGTYRGRPPSTLAKYKRTVLLFGLADNSYIVQIVSICISIMSPARFFFDDSPHSEIFSETFVLARFASGRWRVLVLQYVLGEPAATLCGAVMVIRRPNLPAAVLSQGQGEGRRWRSRRPSRSPSIHHLPQRMRAVQVSVIDQLQHRCTRAH